MRCGSKETPDFIMDLLRRSIEICWRDGRQPLRFRSDAGRLASAPGCPAQEAAMELRTRLNVLAAIISFAFLTAVVFGMF
jgi:hypothetical protein